MQIIRNKKVKIITEKLSERGLSSTESSNSWESNCSTYTDTKPSLTIIKKEDGTIPLYRHAECEAEAIGQSLNLMADLFVALQDAVESVQNNMPGSCQRWAVDRRQLVDDPYALTRSIQRVVITYGPEVVELTPLTRGSFNQWRPVLAIALWLQRDHGVTGLFDRLRNLAIAYPYQSERSEIEAASPVFSFLGALHRLLDRSPSTRSLLSPPILAEEPNLVARVENIKHVGPDFTSSMKMGGIRQSLQIPYAARTAGGKRLEVKQPTVDALASTRGFDTVKRNAPSVGSVSCVPLKATPSQQAGEAISSAPASVGEVTEYDDAELPLWQMMLKVGVA